MDELFKQLPQYMPVYMIMTTGFYILEKTSRKLAELTKSKKDDERIDKVVGIISPLFKGFEMLFSVMNARKINKNNQ